MAIRNHILPGPYFQAVIVAASPARITTDTASASIAARHASTLPDGPAQKYSGLDHRQNRDRGSHGVTSEGVNHKDTKPECPNRGTELKGSHNPKSLAHLSDTSREMDSHVRHSFGGSWDNRKM